MVLLKIKSGYFRNSIILAGRFTFYVSNMSSYVFISYANEDKVVADYVCTKLEENNIDCWIAPRDIIPGDKYVSSLLNAIENATVVVVIFTQKADKSQHVKTEIERAFNLEKTIIPLRMENAEPSDELQYFIGNRQWLDAVTSPLEDHIQLLVNIINNHLKPRLIEVKNIRNSELSSTATEERNLNIPKKIIQMILNRKK